MKPTRVNPSTPTSSSAIKNQPVSPYSCRHIRSRAERNNRQPCIERHSWQFQKRSNAFHTCLFVLQTTPMTGHLGCEGQMQSSSQWGQNRLPDTRRFRHSWSPMNEFQTPPTLGQKIAPVWSCDSENTAHVKTMRGQDR